MESIYVIIFLAILGLLLGSFTGASVWRIRARQLREDKREGEAIDSKEFSRLKPLLKASVSNDRSMCLHCHHQLAWYDLLPLLSWVSTAGKCRYCHEKIGYFEPLIELGTSLLFVVSYLLWPLPLHSVLEIGLFSVWLALGVLLAILFAYDSKWFILPNMIVFSFIALAVIIMILRTTVTGESIFDVVVNEAISLAILSGLYYLLWLLSKGQWVGFGDVKLGIGLGFAIGDWRLALLTLFLANLYGCLVVLPGLVAKKLTRKTHVPFGPLLIAAFITSFLSGNAILQWYLSSFM